MTPAITVFTATYNRADTLHRCYESLVVQTFRDFEWLIIDDGSTDETGEIVDAWTKIADFPIRYEKQANAGKHAAHNRMLALAQGDFVAILDSDDALAPNALERLLWNWNTIPASEQPQFVGVTGLCMDQFGNIVGNRFPQSPLDSTPQDVANRLQVRGEKWGIQRMAVLREYPFPMPKRRTTYLPEGIIWEPIGKKYKTRYVNEIVRIYFVNESRDSISRQPLMSTEQLRRQAPGLAAYRREQLNNNMELLRYNPLVYIRGAVHYVRFSLLSGEGPFSQFKEMKGLRSRLLWAAAFPVGMAVYLRDLMRDDGRGAIEGGLRFGFGKNWSHFLSVLNEDRIAASVAGLRNVLGVERLDGLRFLDAGSGSGLSSLAARRLGAQVYSFDYDADAVACTAELRRRYFPDDPDWHVEQGSVLDEAYLRSLGEFDIVYSWGVLHHTGNMWRALESITLPLKPGGLLQVAIYNDQKPVSRIWRAVKIIYNQLPSYLRTPFVVLAMAPREAISLLLWTSRGKPWGYFEEYKTRGMSKWHDLVDWVGGYPFEVATPEAIFNYYFEKGYSLQYLRTVGGGLGCNEYVFKRGDD